MRRLLRLNLHRRKKEWFRPASPLVVGMFIGIIGLALSLTPVGSSLEENIGLDLLFHLRGPCNSPSDVLIVTLDQESARTLGLPALLRNWPRHMFARLVDKLAQAGAAVIVFDVYFSDPQTPEEDHRFAEAIKNAGNVVLCEHLKREVVVTTEGTVFQLEKAEPPTTQLKNSALASAPFPLPKLPAKVGQFWTFKTEAGGQPTLPVVAFQVFASDAYDEFIKIIQKIDIDRSHVLPSNRETLMATRNTGFLLMTLRDLFKNNSIRIAEQVNEELQNQPALLSDPKKRLLINSLTRMYQRPDSSFLNFYGPPKTIATLPLYTILKSEDCTQPDMKGKAVFIGLSEAFESGKSGQRDGFRTVFSQPDGTDLSGVEIAATAFGNLIEDKPIRPLDLWGRLLIVFFWGVLAGNFCVLSAGRLSVVGIAGLSLGYLALAENQFAGIGLWLPLAVPLLIQGPLAILGGLVCRYLTVKKAGHRTRKAFEFYLPSRVIDQVVKDAGRIETSSQTVWGTVLCSDAADYTALSEMMNLKELNFFLNRYYKVIFEAVKKHEGLVSDIIGDSMLAVWSSAHPEAVLRKRGCIAALEIAKAVDQFNKTSALRLSTRFGLHYGHLLLGHVGGLGRYEYRPIGDVVNTASKIENLNKLFGTKVLASGEVLNEVDYFLTRELGQFSLAGKLKPLKVYELICLKDESDGRQRDRCTMFSQALDFFRTRSWEKASKLFGECLRIDEGDRASLLYLKFCQAYSNNPPDEVWDGLISLEGKDNSTSILKGLS